MFSAFLQPDLSGMKAVHTDARVEKPQPQFVQFVCIRLTNPESALINKHAARSVIFREIRSRWQSIWDCPTKVVKMSIMAV